MKCGSLFWVEVCPDGLALTSSLAVFQVLRVEGLENSENSGKPPLGLLIASMLCSVARITDTFETRSSAIAEITRVGSRYAVQGHSRSLMLVPIESR